MALLVTSASGANGAGYGKLLAFDEGGHALGPFSDDDRIVDPRGVGVKGALLFLNSGSNRILALDSKRRIVGDSGAITATSDRTGTIMSDRGPSGPSSPLRRRSIDRASPCSLPRWSRFHAAMHSARTALSFSLPASVRAARATTPSWPSVRAGSSTPPGMLKTPTSAPLDLAIAPNGNIVVSSQHPFGAPDATITIREYARTDGHPVRVLAPGRGIGFR
jgi:hypothetical protein